MKDHMLASSPLTLSVNQNSEIPPSPQVPLVLRPLDKERLRPFSPLGNLSIIPSSSFAEHGSGIELSVVLPPIHRVTSTSLPIPRPLGTSNSNSFAWVKKKKKKMNSKKQTSQLFQTIH